MATTATSHTFGKYSLVAKLAVGGMAEIFLARLQGAAGFEKLVCIKRILPHLAKDQQLVNMFLAEARIAAQISHPNVCQVFELGEIGGRYFIAMEYLEGVPLSAFRRRDMYPHHPDPRMVAAFGVQACEGLHHAHQLKRPDGNLLEVVHRDVSSSNLFATVDGVVKVLDFGIAKVQDASVRTSTGSVKGTYAYMAPEQLRGERLDRRTDVFAMGIVLWEQFARQHLFKRDTEYLTFQAITNDPIPDLRELAPQMPKELAAVIMSALSRDREQRPPTARALGEALAKSVAPLGGPCQASQIGEEVARAFGARLGDQRELIRVARAGGVLDLEDPLGPAIGHGTELMTTPVSMLSNVGAPVGVPRPSGPLATPARRSPISTTIVLLAAVAAVIAGFYIWTQVSTKPPAATPEPPKVVLLVDAAAATPPPPPVAIDAAEPAVIVDAPVQKQPAPIDAAVTTRHDTRPPRPPPPPPPPKQSGPPGTITIDSTPVYAVIFIDGKRYGETPLVGLSLPPGKHSVRAVSASGTSQSLVINIESGKTAPTRRIEW